MDSLLKLAVSLGVSEEDAAKLAEAATNEAAMLVEAETEKGKTIAGKKNKEAEKLRQTLKELGFDSEKFATVEDYKNAQNHKTELTLEGVREEFMQKLKAEEDRRIAAENERNSESVKSVLASKFSKVYNSEATIAGLMAMNEITIDESGSVLIGGVAPDVFADQWKENNPNSLMLEQAGGSGIVPPTDGGKVNESMTLDEALAAVS